MIQLFKSFSGKGHGDSCWWGHSWVSFLSDLLSNQLGKKLVKCAERSQRVIFKMANNLFRKIMQSASVKWQKHEKNNDIQWLFNVFNMYWPPNFLQRGGLQAPLSWHHVLWGSSKCYHSHNLAPWKPQGSNDVVPPAGEICNGFPFPVEKR